MNDPVKKYLAAIGSKGGQKSKRRLTKKQAREMQLKSAASRARKRAENTVTKLS